MGVHGDLATSTPSATDVQNPEDLSATHSNITTSRDGEISTYTTIAGESVVDMSDIPVPSNVGKLILSVRYRVG